MMTYEELVAEEHSLEADAVEAGRARYRALLEARGGVNTGPGQALMRRTIGSVIEGIQEWQDQATNGTPGRAVGLAKFLCQYDAEEVAFIALRHVVAALHRSDSRLTTVAMQITADLEVVDLEGRLREKDRRLYNRYMRTVKQFSAKNNKTRLGILKRNGEYLGVFNARAGFAWNHSERLQVGVRLLEIVRDRTSLFDTVLSTDPEASGKRSDAAYYLCPTDQTTEWLNTAHQTMELCRPIYYPMVVPPRDWQDTEGGGYLSQTGGFKRPLIKVPPGVFRQEVAASSIPLVTRAINALQRVPFAVHDRVLGVVEANLAAGSVSGLPTKAERREMPPRYEFMDTPGDTWTAEQRALFKAWKRACSEVREHNNRLVCEHRTTATTVAIARKMSRFPSIYFPIQLDFRGRAYPIPSYLQPQGSDLAKGLLTFADARPLGRDGMRWLAIHLANAFGGDTRLDKSEYAERVRWVRQNHVEIVADANDPHRPHALWTRADSPFQFLSAAFEWRDMAQWAADHGSTEDFPSRIPVGLDGSCNGLQHFSAMLRDPVGAAATNLLPSQAPADIYTIVANEVRRRVELDLCHDDPDVVQFARFWMTKGITRRWTKRNTMTLPYGVTRQGMKDQLWAEIGRGAQREFFEGWKIDHGRAVSYLATHNWDAIGTVVVAARSAMDWLHAVARETSAVGAPVMWTTDDGLPVMQRYTQKEEIAVKLFGNNLKLSLRVFSDRLNRRKQALALAPNFVHSVDAAHMRAVTRRLIDLGICSMSMVHDSFGVHAGNVETLSTVIRQEFVSLHSKQILQDFFAGVSPALPDGHEVPPVPASGTLDLAAVLHADYLFA